MMTTTKVDPEIIAGFVREVESYLPKLEQSLQDYRTDPTQTETLEEAYRMTHCIRGAGLTLGLLALSRIAQLGEDGLEQVLSGQLEWSDQAAGALEVTMKQIARYLAGMAAGAVSERELLEPAIVSWRRTRGLPESEDQQEMESLMASIAATETELNQSSDSSLVNDAYDSTPFGSIDDVDVLDQPDASDDLWEIFQQEAEEHLNAIADGIVQMQEPSAPPASLQAMRRGVHTLKGAAGVVGLRSASALARQMQEYLDNLLEGKVSTSPEATQVFYSSFEFLTEVIAGRGAGKGLRRRLEQLLLLYTDLNAGKTPLFAAIALARSDAQESESFFESNEADDPPAPPSASEVVDHVDVAEDLWEAFQQEADEHLQSINELLRDLDPQSPAPETIQSMRRRVHTLKGAAGIVGMLATARLAHRMEDLLDGLYEGQFQFTPDVAPLLFATFDGLTDAITSRGIGEDLHGRLEDIYSRYDGVLRGARVHAAGAPAPVPVEKPKEVAAPAAPQQEKVEHEKKAAAEPLALEEVPAGHKAAQFVRAPLERVDELIRLTSELVIHRSTFEQYLSNYIHEVGELQLSIERLTRISRKLQADYEAAALQETSRRLAFAAIGTRALAGGRDDFDALEFDRYTEFHLLSRDLAETTGDVTNAGSRLNEMTSDFDGYLNRLSRLTGDIEDRLMRLRMLPLRTLSTRLHRTTRVTAERRDKLVDLVIEGEAVELDKTVLEEMAGPLDHLLRNSVDHGIEHSARRRDAGKSERGLIHLRAYHEGTQVVLQIRDDGAGLNPEALREKAMRLGYINETEAAQLSDQDLYAFIFLPGFSTASEVSDISGRGVGLDVVKSTVSRLKGTLSVDSEPGRGVTFTIRLPLTLALTRVVLVKAVTETFAIPLAAVSQILRIEPEQLEHVGRKPVLRLGGKVIPLMHLAEAVGLKQAPGASQLRLKAVVLNIGNQQLALMVDQVIEAREVVVKTLGNLLGSVRTVTGATIMGDGTVVLILNPNDLVQQNQQNVTASPMRRRMTAPEVDPNRTLDVLVVDDSPSVRRVLSNLIKNAGWRVRAAKDGLDALELLHGSPNKPDVVLLDIEMPRMDGYEFTANLRSQQIYKDVPIIMLTSRAGEKHRKRAFETGATDYMVKPYQDDQLLSTVRRVVTEARGAVRQ